MGSQGTVGSQGPQGSQGIPGSQGSVGPQGSVGSQGSQGPQGTHGTMGSQGPQGTPGIPGPVVPLADILAVGADANNIEITGLPDPNFNQSAVTLHMLDVFLFSRNTGEILTDVSSGEILEA